MVEPVESERIWVRLKPFNERKGNKLQRFSIYSMRFEEKRGWYVIPAMLELANGKVVNLAEILRKYRNDNEDPDSALAFDVMSEEEARNLDETQRREAEERKAARDAISINPTDLGVSADPESPEPVHRRGRAKPRKSLS